jgi:hypothetical protein
MAKFREKSGKVQGDGWPSLGDGCPSSERWNAKLREMGDLTRLRWMGCQVQGDR